MLRRSVLFVVLLVAVLAVSSSALGGRHATTPLFPVTVKAANGSVTISKRRARASVTSLGMKSSTWRSTTR